MKSSKLKNYNNILNLQLRESLVNRYLKFLCNELDKFLRVKFLRARSAKGSLKLDMAWF